VAAYNDSGQKQKVTIRMDEKVMGGHGQDGHARLRFTTFGPDGQPKDHNDFVQTGTFEFQGALGNGQLMLGEWSQGLE